MAVFVAVSGMFVFSAAQKETAATPTTTVLMDAPAGPGERPLAMNVWSTPKAYEAETGKKIAEYSEAPELATKVAAGTLPPVDQRLPAEPVVVKPDEAVGKYGGVFNTIILGTDISGTLQSYLTLDPLTNFSPDGSKTIPNVAQGWDSSSDGKMLTLYLRRGLKWSDGTPFTAADLEFWYEDRVMNQQLTPVKPTIMQRGGQIGAFKKVDDYTVTFTFVEPYPIFVTYLGAWGSSLRVDTVMSPEHYLKQFHPSYAKKEDIDKAMKAEGTEEWTDFFGTKVDRNNPDLPRLHAWLPLEDQPVPIQRWVRNPYYFRVDTEGNQLPYINEMRAVRIADAEAAMLEIMAGEIDLSRLVMVGGMVNYPLLYEKRNQGDFRFAYGTWMPAAFANIMFNFNHPDPSRAQLYRDVRFRRAMSVALNREEINQIIFKGQCIPSQVAPLFGPPYHGESDMFKVYTQHDPDLANKLLDEIGISKRDDEGFRMGLDGKKMLLVISATLSWPHETPEVMGMVKDYWATVGINVTVKAEQGNLWYARHNAGEHDVSARGSHFGGGPVPPSVNQNTFCLSGWQPAPEWATWLDSGGASGVEPPDDIKKIRALREEILGEPSFERQVELTKQAWQLHMDNLWTIGVVVDDPKQLQQTILRNRVRNVPTVTAGEWYPSVPASWFINE